VFIAGRESTGLLPGLLKPLPLKLELITGMAQAATAGTNTEAEELRGGKFTRVSAGGSG
jgi:hypothetical protein